MRTDDFDYYLPEKLIAQTPLLDRSASRMMTLDRKTGEVTDDVFKNFPNFLEKGDCIVINDTRVIPARLYGTKKDNGGSIEFLLLKRRTKDEWEVILKPGKRAKQGAEFEFGGKLFAKVLEVLPDGNRVVRFSYEGLFENVLEELGEMPLPHYITKKLEDKERYQTVYAKNEGSAAAPTAGLHFTNEILEEIRKKGVNIAHVTLHVGLGTFRPVKVDDVTKHKMHSEYFIIDEDCADIINTTKENGKKVVCIGTTSCRAVESAVENGKVVATEKETDIFIYPGYEFKVTDRLLTNFHLPKSTLIMLVSALAGKENVLNAYKKAVDLNYRFFSFGDCMFIK